MNYYYAGHADRPVGPVSLKQLHALAREGMILPDTLVIVEGAEEWQPYRSLDGAVVPPSSKSLVRVESHPPLVNIGPPPLPISAATKICPFCAEHVAAAAKKCKHCGEIIDVVLRATEEARRAHHPPPHIYMNTGGAIHTTLLAVQKRNFPHGWHFVFTFFSAGLWLPIWFLHYLGRDRNHYW